MSLKLYGKLIAINSQIEYLPIRKNLLDYYKIEQTIYNLELSPCSIYLGVDKDNRKVAIKQVLKSRISNEHMTEFIRNEMAVHSFISKMSDNIINLYEYYEDENSYSLILEYCNLPTYFENLLEDVLFIILKLIRNTCLLMT